MAHFEVVLTGLDTTNTITITNVTSITVIDKYGSIEDVFDSADFTGINYTALRGIELMSFLDRNERPCMLAIGDKDDNVFVIVRPKDIARIHFVEVEPKPPYSGGFDFSKPDTSATKGKGDLETNQETDHKEPVAG